MINVFTNFILHVILFFFGESLPASLAKPALFYKKTTVSESI